MRHLFTALICTAAVGAALPSAATAKPAASMKAAWRVVHDEQNKELSGRYVEPHSGPISSRNAYCSRRSPRKVHCYYATFFIAPDRDETDETVDGYACGRSIDVRLPRGKRKPVRKVRWQACEVLRYGGS